MRHFKYLKIFLIILLIFSFFLTQGPAYSSQEVIISEQAVEKFANLWKDEYLGRFSEIKDIIKIINEDDEIIGYYVTFDPKGYVVIDINNNEFPVVEFSTEGENIYTILENYVLSTGGKIDKTERKVLYSILPFQYGLKYKKDGKTKIIDTMFGEQNLVIYKDISKKLKQFNKVKKVDEVGINSGTIWDGIIDYSELPGTYVASKSIIGASSFEPSIMTDFRQDKGNCAPTAITNLMKYYYQKRNKTKILVNNSVEDTYEKIVELAGKEEGYYWSEIKSVTVDYLNYVKYNYSTVNYWFDYWSDFKRDLDDDWPVLTAVDHFNDKGERTGHTVVALGYHIRKVDGKDVNFLQVADGWYRTTFRYLNFDYYKSVLIDGFCVKVYDLK